MAIVNDAGAYSKHCSELFKLSPIDGLVLRYSDFKRNSIYSILGHTHNLSCSTSRKNLVELLAYRTVLFDSFHQISSRSQSTSQDPRISVNVESLFSNATSLSDIGNIISNALKSKLASL